MLLDAHLDQLEICAATIAELSFTPPKIFTNAMLNSHDITALIRDTEAHERALFTLAPPEELFPPKAPQDSAHRRNTTFEIGRDMPHLSTTIRGPRRNIAITAFLGGDLAAKLQRERTKPVPTPRDAARQTEELNVDLLLQGAERLCASSPIPGAADKITALRRRHEKVMESINHYERLIADQDSHMQRMFHGTDAGEQYDTDDFTSTPRAEPARDEDDVKDLERKKQMLEARVTGMERDLGGLLR